MPIDAARDLTFAQALREGVDQAMERDARVLLIGEGVPDPKSIFSTTEGLQKKYGTKRVFDMPLSENGMTGVCIGAALSGMRPVLVHQRIDFALLSMDQLVNNAAKWYYMFNGKASVPIVVRMIIGRGWGQGPQHSQSLQAMFAQVPGLKVVMPTTAYDAKGMMIAAIEDENPVMFIEHRWLHHVKDSVPPEPYRTSLDKANVLIEGVDISIAAFSHMAVEAYLASKALLDCTGIKAEVIDLRSARPLDMDTVLTSVRKTGRLLVADPALKTGGLSGEIVAQVTERAFEALVSKPSRIAMPDYPVPSSPFLAETYYPGAREIAEKVVDALGYDRNSEGYKKLVEATALSGRHDVPNFDFTGPF